MVRTSIASIRRGSEKRSGNSSYINQAILWICSFKTRRQKTIKVAGIDAGGDKIRVLENCAEEREIRLDAPNKILVQGPAHALNGSMSIGCVSNELRQHRIVIERNGPSLVDAAILTNTRSRWLVQSSNFSGRREEIIFRIFSVDAALDRMTANRNVFLAKWKFFAGSNPQLQVY